MGDKSKIPYDKKNQGKSRRYISGSGPRDMQRKHNLGRVTINMPSVNTDEFAKKELVFSDKTAREELRAEILKEMEDLKEIISKSSKVEGAGLPFEVVEQKIKEAVEYTERQAVERYESGLSNLNNQLNTSKSRIKELEFVLNEERREFNNLKRLLEEKDTLINNFKNGQIFEISDLKSKILDLIDKIKDGNINKNDFIDDTRPILEDKIFIDPLDSVEVGLEPHIDIKAAEAEGYKADLKGDLAKLRDLYKDKNKP